MLRIKPANMRVLSSVAKRSIRPTNVSMLSSFKRFTSANVKPTSEFDQVYTKLSDENDPNRDAFFKYTWGSWLKNDKLEKEKRFTKFSVEGVTKVLQNIFNTSKEVNQSKSLDKSGSIIVSSPTKNEDNTVTLSQNLSLELLGQLNPNEELFINSMASIHEGRHHRIYKITTNNEKEFVLRIPYALDTEYATSLKIKSEVATMDFLKLKLGVNVPKIISYGADSSNPLQAPYILMEYLPGDLLMKQWNPVLMDNGSTSAETKEKLLKVINPLADLQEKLVSITFNKFGSLYFYDDVDASLAKDLPYEGETDPLLINRWRIGPTVERIYLKDKQTLKKTQIEARLGPWDKENPLELIKSVADVELETLRSRLALAEADSAGVVEDIETIKLSIKCFEDLQKISHSLFKADSPAIPNVQELFRPRLFAPDIDPMNVIMRQSDKSEEVVPYFIDFENACIKPFILQNAPSFVAYDSTKIYDLKEIEGFEEFSENDKEQCYYMYIRTRNQHLWEAGLNARRQDLISAVAPPVKFLRAPYIRAIQKRTDRDYLYVEGAIIQLQEVWELYHSNSLVPVEKFPIEYTAEELDTHASKLQEYQEEAATTPFLVTKGWVPQDMFSRLQDQGVIVKDGEDHKILPEA